MPGTLVNSPADVLRYVLIEDGLGVLANSGVWPIGVGVEADSPDDAITIYDTTGIGQGRTMPDGETQEMHGIQVRIRAARYEPGYTKARSIAVHLDTVYQKIIVVKTHTYCVHSIGRISDVISLGKESPQSKRILFTVNALVCIRMKE